ncbi:MAG: glycosyltransferase [Candidatus Omnitrophica bacterium]|nr:glycosyltransferase [Candidatus Omnitrophota bacterium]
MRIAIFFNPSPGTIGEYFRRALAGLGHAVDHFTIAEAARCPGGYDLHLRIDHGDYAEDIPAWLHPAAFYVVDAHLARSWVGIQRQATRYELVFCAQRRAAQQLARAHWVPLGCDPEIHRPRGGAARYDVAFVGTDGGVPRKFLLQELRERFPQSFIGRAPYDRMAELYSGSKIGFHYIECTSPLKDHVSMRVYEVLASGTMLLANALEAGAFEAVGLRDRQELAVYRTPGELFELAAYYLAREAERRRIAAAGHRLVAERHTYRHRAEQIVEISRKELGIRG